MSYCTSKSIKFEKLCLKTLKNTWTEAEGCWWLMADDSCPCKWLARSVGRGYTFFRAAVKWLSTFHSLVTNGLEQRVVCCIYYRYRDNVNVCYGSARWLGDRKSPESESNPCHKVVSVLIKFDNLGNLCYIWHFLGKDTIFYLLFSYYMVRTCIKICIFNLY
jgi:hypothetical protein